MDSNVHWPRAYDICETCDGLGKVEDRSGNFPDRPGVNAGPFIEKMDCPDCGGTGARKAGTHA